ncbi:MAG TPA: SPASM domain-containing protein, partial [Thermoanaerobaculia bacterium]|nr:SPASM domain-containing protein [Thermoanaerobaculia bacterium]
MRAWAAAAGAECRTAPAIFAKRNGDLLPCTVLPLVAGSVLARPFAEVWREAPLLARLRALRRKDLPVCGTCAAFAACGRCHAEALLEGGDL